MPLFRNIGAPGGKRSGTGQGGERKSLGLKMYWRHTFASYHAKTYADFGKLQMEMGHRSAELLRNRYTNMAWLTKEMAKRFWVVMPKGE